MPNRESSDLLIYITSFCRALRARGLLVTPAESIDAARTLGAVDLGDREDVYLALRALLASRREDRAPFDELFDEWWGEGQRSGERTAAERKLSRNPAVHVPSEEPRAAKGAEFLLSWARSAAEAADDDGTIPLAAPSPNEAAGAKDFSAYAADDLGAVEEAARRIARRLRTRPGRRWKSASRGARLHLRRMMRLSLAAGGDSAELAFRERKPRRTKLVALCDVSGSMDLYSRFLLQFLFALQRACGRACGHAPGGFARVETFAFSTRLVRLTGSLARGSYREALDALARLPGWSGGTKIGESVAAFLSEWPRLLDRRTVVILLSDGWDTGEPELLADALRRIHHRAARVVWLNPLLGSPSYRPLTRGMQAALPHVDVFASAHDLPSLEAFARHLSV